MVPIRHRPPPGLRGVMAPYLIKLKVAAAKMVVRNLETLREKDERITQRHMVTGNVSEARTWHSVLCHVAL